MTTRKVEKYLPGLADSFAESMKRCLDGLSVLEFAGHDPKDKEEEEFFQNVDTDLAEYIVDALWRALRDYHKVAYAIKEV